MKNRKNQDWYNLMVAVFSTLLFAGMSTALLYAPFMKFMKKMVPCAYYNEDNFVTMLFGLTVLLNGIFTFYKLNKTSREQQKESRLTREAMINQVITQLEAEIVKHEIDLLYAESNNIKPTTELKSEIKKKISKLEDLKLRLEAEKCPIQDIGICESKLKLVLKKWLHDKEEEEEKDQNAD
jgi:membrane-bound ClpP family serine protease